MAVIRRIRHTPALSFGPFEWLPVDALDETYFQMLASGQTTVTAEEAAILAAAFAEDGELPGRRDRPLHAGIDRARCMHPRLDD